MMEDPLLGVAAKGTKVFVGEVAQEPWRDLAPRPREVEFPESPLDPHIDGKDAEPFIGEEERTLRDLWTHPRQFAQLEQRGFVIERGHRLQIEGAFRDEVCR